MEGQAAVAWVEEVRSVEGRVVAARRARAAAMVSAGDTKCRWVRPTGISSPPTVWRATPGAAADSLWATTAACQGQRCAPPESTPRAPEASLRVWRPILGNDGGVPGATLRATRIDTTRHPNRYHQALVQGGQTNKRNFCRQDYTISFANNTPKTIIYL